MTASSFLKNLTYENEEIVAVAATCGEWLQGWTTLDRALRYKLFFVKALTKRLRKLTIITKRLQ
jgi:hypothetical protein